MRLISFFAIFSLFATACAVDEPSESDIGEATEELLNLGLTPTLSTISPSSGAPGTTVRITGQRLYQLSCVGGSQISQYFLYYGNTTIGCTYNSADGSIRVVVPSNATASASFYLKQWVRTDFCISPCYLQTVSVSPLFTLILTGTVRIVDNAQVSVLSFLLNGAPQAGTIIAPGGAESFTVAPGSYSDDISVGFDPNAGPAANRVVCHWLGTVTVTAGQTSTVTLPAFTAGQVLTHCSGSIDYDQGSFVDLNGFHTVSMRFFANNTFIWFLDGVQQPGGTIASTSFVPPTLGFTLSSGDVISMGFPYATFNIFVNGNPVQLVRASGW